MAQEIIPIKISWKTVEAHGSLPLQERGLGMVQAVLKSAGVACWTKDVLAMQSRVEHRLFLWDFSNEARWRDTCQTQSTFLDEIMNTGGFISQIWSIPGFTINGCIPDFMHCVDLGITQSVCGNITWELIRWLGAATKNGKQLVVYFSTWLHLHRKTRMSQNRSTR